MRWLCVLALAVYICIFFLLPPDTPFSPFVFFVPLSPCLHLYLFCSSGVLHLYSFFCGLAFFFLSPFCLHFTFLVFFVSLQMWIIVYKCKLIVVIFFIENPRGMLRKMPFMQEFKRHTIWYCQYGDDRAKPTDVWTNSETWKPRKECKNGNQNCHHQRAPRGSKTGTQGKKGSYDRSIIPSELCKEIMESTLKKYAVAM